MSKVILSLLVAAGTLATSVNAEPVKLSKAQLDKVVAGAITAVKVNGGGNTPQGKANGVPTENQNPTGFPPPGQNK